MDDKTKRTKSELNSGLSKIVSYYQVAQAKGQDSLAASLKKSIDNIIKAKNLDAKIVYSFSEGKTVPIKFNFSDNTEL